MYNPICGLARDGLPIIGLFALATLVTALVRWPGPAVILLALTAFSLNFFRDPDRAAPTAPGIAVAPADGVVCKMGEAADPLTGEMRQVVCIFMNVFNVHVNRIPLAGTVERVVLTPGRFYAADKDKAVLHNERCALTVATPAGARYAVVQIAGLIARRIVCRAEPGDRVTAGQRYGMIRFGSRLDLYLPLATEIRVREGELVRAGESVLGLLRESAGDKA